MCKKYPVQSSFRSKVDLVLWGGCLQTVTETSRFFFSKRGYKKRCSDIVPFVLINTPSFTFDQCQLTDLPSTQKYPRSFTNILSMRRPASMKDLFARADVCSNKSCATAWWCKSNVNWGFLTCQQILNTHTSICHATGSLYTILCNITYKNKKVVYLLQCRYGMQYFWQTRTAI